jgi:hypothetical protein
LRWTMSHSDRQRLAYQHCYTFRSALTGRAPYASSYDVAESGITPVVTTILYLRPLSNICVVRKPASRRRNIPIRDTSTTNSFIDVCEYVLLRNMSMSKLQGTTVNPHSQVLCNLLFAPVPELLRLSSLLTCLSNICPQTRYPAKWNHCILH